MAFNVNPHSYCFYAKSICEHSIQLSSHLYNSKLLTFDHNTMQCSPVSVSQHAFLSPFVRQVQFFQTFFQAVKILDTVSNDASETIVTLLTEVPTIWATTIWPRWNSIGQLWHDSFTASQNAVLTKKMLSMCRQAYVSCYIMQKLQRHLQTSL